MERGGVVRASRLTTPTFPKVLALALTYYIKVQLVPTPHP